jgi:hypothetical protein
MCTQVFNYIPVLRVMELTYGAYPTEFAAYEGRYIYTFISSGERRLLKMVVITAMDEAIYNLGLIDAPSEFDGALERPDNDSETTLQWDQIPSNNGDVRKVFHTVALIAGDFFELEPDATLIIIGSDESDEFAQRCKASCGYNCESGCKKRGQRMRVYNGQLSKHIDVLRNDYHFIGRLKGSNDFEDYQVGTNYAEVRARKKR